VVTPESGASRGEVAPRDVPSLRDDRDAEDAALDRRLTLASDDPDAVGAALLARLGLTYGECECE
jgi:hypothetical protein